MKPGDVLNEDFIKQFKSGLELTSFLEQLRKRDVENILEGELNAHLDYDKHQKSKTSNPHNVYTTKKLKTTLGETQTQVSRNRESSFNPMIVKKRKSAT